MVVGFPDTAASSQFHIDRLSPSVAIKSYSADIYRSIVRRESAVTAPHKARIELESVATRGTREALC